MSVAPTASRRQIRRGLLRALLSSTLLVALYHVSPLDHVHAVPRPVSLIIALLVLLGVRTWQVRAISRAPSPGLRAVEALAMVHRDGGKAT